MLSYSEMSHSVFGTFTVFLFGTLTVYLFVISLWRHSAMNSFSSGENFTSTILGPDELTFWCCCSDSSVVLLDDVEPLVVFAVVLAWECA